jgi:hypothetical protein
MNIYKNLCKNFPLLLFLKIKIIFYFYIRNDYKDYQLESRLHFRINAAMQKVKRMDNDSYK